MKQLMLLVSVILFHLVGITTAQFSDVTLQTTYGESILGLHGLGVVKGYPDGEFKADQGVTRAEMMKIVLEASLDGIPLPQDAKHCFDDVSDERYAQYVCYGKDQGMIKGYPDGSFGPDHPVTVAEGLKIAINAFTDRIAEGEGDRWYQPYMDFVHANSIFSKYAMIPSRAMSRGEMSELAYLLYQEKQGEIQFDGVRDSRSPGCFTDYTPPGAITSFTVRGQQRSAIVDIGKKVNHDDPAPLILAFHGRTNSNEQVRGYYKVQREASGEGIWIYPSGLPEDSSPRSRRASGDPVDEIRVYELFDEIVKTYSEQYCIDMDRIYVVGHSLGGWVTNTLACARGDMIRAMGSVGGSASSPTCAGPAAAIIMHHPEDRLASFQGGVNARDQLLRQNSCLQDNQPLKGGPSEGNCVQYTQCQEGADVVWCPHSDSTAYNGTYYPHTRPNFAADAIWKFFEENS